MVIHGAVNGIGPEIALRAIGLFRRESSAQLVLVGSAPILREWCRRLRQPFPGAWSPERVPRPTDPVAVWDPAPALTPTLRPGRAYADAGRAAAAWIDAAVGACRAGRLDALVTAPISKEGFQKAGVPYPGHTEFLAALTGARRFAMLLFGGPLRVILVTRHLPLARVAAALTRANILAAIELAAEGLPWLGCRAARIGVCGLNPHAGDGGLLGREEIEKIAPAVRAARRQGCDVRGPIPADVIFHQAVRGQFDAVIAMYHDQGLAPLKMLAFETGVNVTLGLPIVRTSPDHGTAYDIAGRGRANPASMLAAIRWADKLIRRRNPWSG